MDGLIDARGACEHHHAKAVKPVTSRFVLFILILSLVLGLVLLIITAPKHPVALLRVVDAKGQPIAGATILPEGLRTKEELAHDLDLVEGAVSDEAILEAMTENPILIERPIVETEKGVRLCRPQDKVREIL